MSTDQDQPLSGDPRRRSPLNYLVARIPTRRRAPFRTIAIVAAVLAVAGAAYVVGAPATGTSQAAADSFGPQSAARAAAGAPGDLSNTYGMGLPSSAPSAALSVTKGGQAGTGATTPSGQDQLAATLDAGLIVKTGQVSLEVTNLDSAVSQAQSTIAGMGGYIAQSSRAGSDGTASATVTYRLPVARWDDALVALRKLASKVVSEQTDSSDVTSQAIDLDARLGNLKATESALQAIMARASAIPDVLAVEQQLSSTQGEIEQLTAERAHLGDQASMSTVTVTFLPPSETVTTQTAQGWQLGGQVDQAVAQLVRIGQGLATIGVWAVIVGLPVALAMFILFLAWRLTRRISGRGRPRGTTPAAPDQAAA